MIIGDFQRMAKENEKEDNYQRNENPKKPSGLLKKVGNIASRILLWGTVAGAGMFTYSKYPRDENETKEKFYSQFKQSPELEQVVQEVKIPKEYFTLDGDTVTFKEAYPVEAWIGDWGGTRHHKLKNKINTQDYLEEAYLIFEGKAEETKGKDQKPEMKLTGKRFWKDPIAYIIVDEKMKDLMDSVSSRLGFYEIWERNQIKDLPEITLSKTNIPGIYCQKVNLKEFKWEDSNIDCNSETKEIIKASIMSSLILDLDNLGTINFRKFKNFRNRHDIEMLEAFLMHIYILNK